VKFGSERLNSGTRNGDFAKSKGEARRLIWQKAVKVDGQVVSDVDFEFRGGVHRLVEVGKTRIAQAAGE